MPLTRRVRLWLVVFAMTLAATGCAGATGEPPEVADATPTVIAPPVAATATPRVTSEASTVPTGVTVEGQLLILHTNDVLGYVDPCG